MSKLASDEFKDFCTLIGSMTITWAWAENALALAIGIMDKNAPQLRRHTEIPVSMTKKLRYLRDAISDIPMFKVLYDDGNRLANKFSELAVRRNKLVHASTWQLENGSFETLGVTVKGRTQTIGQGRVTSADALVLIVEVIALADDAGRFLIDVESLRPETP